MSQSPAPASVLRSRGLRVTPQRLLLWEILQRHDSHMSADQIYELATQQYPQLSRVTVYRALDDFHAAGLVTVGSFGGRCLVYERTDQGLHHHLVCSACGKHTAVAPDLLREIEQQIHTRYGFYPHFEHLAIHGLCQDCHGKQQALAHDPRT